MAYLLSRLSEPSSWAGLAVIASTLNVPLAPEVLQPVIYILSGAAGLAAVLLGERPRQ